MNSQQLLVVQNVPTFRRYKHPNETAFIPEIKERRKSTDVTFLITFVVCVVILFGVMIYVFVNADINRLIHGYDYCGNVCGLKNEPVSGIICSGQDMTDKPYLDHTANGPTCLQSCKSGSRSYRCSDWTSFSVFQEIINEEKSNLIILCVSGLGFSILATLLFRYFPKEFVWTMLVGSILSLFALAGFLWYLYATYPETKNTGNLVVAILVTVVAVIVALCISVLIPKINLIIFFFQEAARTIFAMPLLLFEPFLIYVTAVGATALFVFTLVLGSTSGTIQEIDPGLYDYVPNEAMTFSIVWNVVMLLWFLFFLMACQQMIVSGAVSIYYFSKDKSRVVSPIFTSLYNLVRFHLGSAAFGSTLWLLCQIIKIILTLLSTYNRGFRCLQYCFNPIDNLVKYVTSMGYIVVAIHGQPLCRSSYRAINLVVSNLLSALVLNSIGNFVFYLAKFLVVALVVVIGILCKFHIAIITVGGIVTFFCVHSFLVIFEIGVDSIFICFCEDLAINDGRTKHYYTTKEMHMKIMEAQQFTINSLKNKKQ